MQECFEEFRQAEADRVEEAWSELAERFRAKTKRWVNRVRATAADLFTISLPDVAVPEVSSEREQFFYLFLHVDPLGEELLRVLRRVLPPALLRRRMLARAPCSWPASSTNTPNASPGPRATPRTLVRRRFELAMSEELEGTIDAITAAAEQGKELQRVSETEREIANSARARRRARRRAVRRVRRNRRNRKAASATVPERAERLLACPCEPSGCHYLLHSPEASARPKSRPAPTRRKLAEVHHTPLLACGRGHQLGPRTGREVEPRRTESR